MPLKYLPWCFLVLLLLFGGGSAALLGCLVGYYQHVYLKCSLVPLPLEFYYKVEGWLPKLMKEDAGFVPIRPVENDLRSICRRTASSQSGSALNADELMNDRVDAGGSGVAIGGAEQL
jgi:hypothetical protein